MMEGICPAIQYQSRWLVFLASHVSPIKTTTSYAPNGVTRSRLSVHEYPNPSTRISPKEVSIEFGIFAVKTQYA
jgi:hypothetical protein